MPLSRLWEKDLKIFDIDGTLLNAKETYLAWIRKFTSELDSPVLKWKSEEEKERLYLKAVADHRAPHWFFPWDNDKIEKAYKIFSEHTQEDDAEKYPLIDWAKEIIEEIHEKWIIVAFFTSKTKSAVESVFNYHWLSHHLKEWYLVAREDVVDKKPSPEWLLKILKHTWISVGKAIYFWDWDVDHDSAKNAGMDFVWVNTWSNFEKDWENLWVTSIESIAELKAIITSF